MWQDLKLPPITYPLKLLAIYAVVGGVGGVLFLIGAAAYSYPTFAAGAVLGLISGVLSAKGLRKYRLRLDRVSRIFSHA